MTKKEWGERQEETQADLRWGRKRRPEQTKGGGRGMGTGEEEEDTHPTWGRQWGH